MALIIYMNKKKSKKVRFPKFLYWLIPVIVVLALIMYVIVYFNAVNHITIESSNITKITNFNSSGFTTHINIKLKNPSNVNIHIKKIEYALELGGSKKKYTIDDVYIKKRNSKTIRIKPRVSYGFTYDFIKDRLLGSDNTTLYLSGNIIVMKSPIIVSVPFKDTYDMKDELTDYITDKAKDAGEDLIDDAEDFVDNLFN